MSMNGFLTLSIRIAGTLALTCSAIPQSTNRYVIGATFVRPWPSCPAYVSAVIALGPAASAGLGVGDELLAVSDRDATNLPLEQTIRLLRSETPGRVLLRIRRNRQDHAITIVRDKQKTVTEKQATELRVKGMKIVNGAIVPKDTTDAEIRNMETFQGDRVIQSVFPLHYPTDPSLYYGGFEVFILRAPPQIAVGGIEKGPAALAGVHWGDIILSIDGIDPTGKDAAELSGMLSSREPRVLHLRLDRLGVRKDMKFGLMRTADLLKQNHLKIFRDLIIPDALNTDDYLECVPAKP